jgi:serine/threonine-protein kinase RsbW
MPMRMEVSLTLPRKPVSVPLARGLVASTLERAGVTAEVVHDISVALTEACTNAYKHGQGGDTYEIRVSLDDKFFAMEVLDRGPGFGSRTVQAAAAHGDPAHDEAEGGRGIGVIRALTDAVAFQGTTGDGSVQMRKRVTWRDRSPWQVEQLAHDVDEDA